MAENESLDLRICRRWNAVLGAIRKGQPLDVIAAMADERLRRGWAETQKQLLSDYGIPLGDVFDAAIVNDDKRLREQFRITRSHEYVDLIRSEQRPLDTPDQLAVRVVDASVTKVLHQIRDRLLSTGVVKTVLEAQSYVGRLGAKLSSSVDQIAAALAEAPSRVLRVGHVKVAGITATTADTLRMSLLRSAHGEQGGAL